MSKPAPFHAEIADAPSGASVFWCETADNTRIRGAIWRNGKRGTVILMPGRTEYIEKYGRVVTRLLGMGFSVITLDWRGQGLSDRPDNSTALGHVEEFGDYQLDLEAVLNAPEAADLPEPRVIFAHSMGGCIALRALLGMPDVKAAVLSAPMWGIGMSKPMRSVAQLILRAAHFLGQEKRHAPGTNATFYVQDCEYESNTLTSDPQSYAWIKSHLDAFPELGLGGPSIHWLKAAFDELADLHSGPKPATPVLTFLGTDEEIVDPDAITSLHPKLPNGKLVMCENARHEIWLEKTDIQEPVWQEIDSFLENITPA